MTTKRNSSIKNSKIISMLSKLTTDNPMSATTRELPIRDEGIKTISNIDEIVDEGEYKLGHYTIRIVRTRSSLLGEVYSAQVWENNHKLKAEFVCESIDEVKKALKRYLQE